MTESLAPAEHIKDAVVETLGDLKGKDIQVLDVRQLTDVTDYMIIASGTSDRHVKSMSRHLRDALREQHDVRPLGIEGEDQGDWVLIDFGDAVVHIMRPQTRQFYDLERLWGREVQELLKLNRDRMDT